MEFCVRKNSNVSNLSETPLEGNEDHLLNRARTDLARKEIHVESLNKCIDDLQKQTEVQDVHHKKYNVNLLNESRRETSSITRGITAKRESSSRYSDSKYARIGKR